MQAPLWTSATSHTTISFHGDVAVTKIPYASPQYKENALVQLQDQLNNASSPEEFQQMLGQMKLGLAGGRAGNGTGVELFQHLFANRNSGMFSKTCTESGSLALVAYTFKIFGARILDHNSQIDRTKLTMAMNMLFGNKMPEIQCDLAKVKCEKLGKHKDMDVYQLSTKKYEMTLTESLHNYRDASIHDLIRKQDVYKPFFYDKTIDEVAKFIGPGPTGEDAPDLPHAFDFCLGKKDSAKQALGDVSKTGLKVTHWDGFRGWLQPKYKAELASRVKSNLTDRFGAATERMAKDKSIYSSKVETYLSPTQKITQDVTVKFIGDSGSSEMSKPGNRKMIAVPLQDPGEKPGHLDLSASASATEIEQSTDEESTGFPRDKAFLNSRAELLDFPNTVYSGHTKVCVNDTAIVDRDTYNLGSQYGGTPEENAVRAYKALDYMVQDFMQKYPRATEINISESRLLNGFLGYEKKVFKANQAAFQTAVANYNMAHPKLKVNYVSVHVEAHQDWMHTLGNGVKTIGEIVPEELQEVTPGTFRDFGDVNAMRESYKTHFTMMEPRNQKKYQQVMDKWLLLTNDLKNMNNAIAYLALTAILTDALNEDQKLHALGIKFMDPFGCKSAKDRTTCAFEGAIKVLMVLIKLDMQNEHPDLRRFFNDDGTFNYKDLSAVEKVIIDDTFDPDYTHAVSGIGTNVPSNKNPGILLTFFKDVPCIKNAAFHIVDTDD